MALNTRYSPVALSGDACSVVREFEPERGRIRARRQDRQLIRESLDLLTDRA